MEHGTEPRMTKEEASRDLAANEDFLCRMDYLTDRELREQLKAAIRLEKADQMNGPPAASTTSCPAPGKSISRRARPCSGSWTGT